MLCWEGLCGLTAAWGRFRAVSVVQCRGRIAPPLVGGWTLLSLLETLVQLGGSSVGSCPKACAWLEELLFLMRVRARAHLLPSACIKPHMPKTGLPSGPEPGAGSAVGTETQLLKPTPTDYQGPLSWKLESGVQPGLKPSCPHMGCSHLNQ